MHLQCESSLSDLSCAMAGETEQSDASITDMAPSGELQESNLCKEK